MNPTCPHCRQAFARPDYRDLHVGRAHRGEMEAPEAVAFAMARAAEERTMRKVRRHVRGGLTALPFLLLFVAVVLIAAYAGVLLLAFLPVPGVIAFLALIYLFGYSQKEPGEA